MGRLLDSEYWEDRPVPHVAQGDLFEDVAGAVVVPTPAASTVAGRGQRKRPQVPGGLSLDTPDDQVAQLLGPASLALVCSYTCTFLAQPGSLRDYSHPYRLVAPVWPLGALVDKAGLKAGDARNLMSSGGLSGLLYLPAPPGVDAEEAPEWGTGMAALLYRITTVRHDVLERRRRVARLTAAAQQVLITRLIHLVSPNLYDHNDENLTPPDMSDGWA
jgi:hypothetical protein